MHAPAGAVRTVWGALIALPSIIASAAGTDRVGPSLSPAETAGLARTYRPRWRSPTPAGAKPDGHAFARRGHWPRGSGQCSPRWAGSSPLLRAPISLQRPFGGVVVSASGGTACETTRSPRPTPRPLPPGLPGWGRAAGFPNAAPGPGQLATTA